MSFHNVRLPVEYEVGAGGGPGFKTNVATLDSGFEKRNSNWAQERCSWNISYGLQTFLFENPSYKISTSDFNNFRKVISFFRLRRGAAYGFRFKDWLDYEVGDVDNDVYQPIGLGDDLSTEYQIYKLYDDDGGFTYTRKLTRIVAGRYKVFIDGVEKVETTDYSIDIDTGLITFTSAPTLNQIVSVACEFDVPVRFDGDELNVSYNGFMSGSIPDIGIVEVRE